MEKIKVFYTLKNYKLKYLSKDIISGIVICLMTIPISMGYSEVAGLPAVYGLYGSLLPVLLFAVFSTSRQFIFGVDAAPAAIVGSTIAGLGIVSGSEEALKVVPFIALISGIWLILFYIIKADRILKYISTPVMGGFISGIAVTVIMMQIPKLLGSKAGSGEIVELVKAIIAACENINLLSLLLGIITIVVILISKKLFPKFPMPVVMMAAGALLEYFCKLSIKGVKTLSAVSTGLPDFKIPFISIDKAGEYILPGLTIALVVMAETLLAENNFAAKNDYKIHERNEILACAAGNIAAAVSGSCPVNGSVSRTSMNDQYGGRTQVVSMVAVVAMAAILMFGTGFIGYLPVPVLTAIVICALTGVVELHLAVRLFKVKRSEFYIFIGAFLGVLVLGSIYGVIIGMMLSFVNFAIMASRPPRSFLGIIPGHEGFHRMVRNEMAKPIKGVLIYRFSENLFFANAKLLVEDIENEIKEDTKAVIIDAGNISSIDITAADYIEQLYKNLKKQKIRMYITEHPYTVNRQLEKIGVGYMISEGAVRRTITNALVDMGYKEPYPLEGVEMDKVERVFDCEEENSFQEFVWLYGDRASEMMEKRIIDTIDGMSNQCENEIEAALDEFERYGSVDEDELLTRLELHLKEIADKIDANEEDVLKRIEARRHIIENHMAKEHPDALGKLRENMERVNKHLKAEHPKEYQHMQHLHEKLEKKHKDSHKK